MYVVSMRKLCYSDYGESDQAILRGLSYVSNEELDIYHPHFSSVCLWMCLGHIQRVEKRGDQRINPTVEMSVTYSTGWGCGQQLMKNRAIEFQGRIYCYPCLQEIKGLSFG